MYIFMSACYFREKHLDCYEASTYVYYGVWISISHTCTYIYSVTSLNQTPLEPKKKFGLERFLD